MVDGPSGRRFGTGPGISYTTGTDGVDDLLDAVRVACQAAGPTADVERICLGMAGLPGEPDARARLAEGLRTLFPAAEILIGPDGVLAHAGALGTPGVVICAGTGTVVLAVGESGSTARLDAWGPLIGDRGSGYAIGAAGLRAAAAAIDGVGPATVLVEAMAEVLGGVDLASMQRLHRNPAQVTVIADFARHVAAAAYNADPPAMAIMRQAAGDLAATAIAAARRVDLDRPGTRVAIVGRVAQAGDPLLRPLRAALSDSGLTLVAAAGDALDGGLKIAVHGAASLYEDSLERHPAKGVTRC